MSYRCDVSGEIVPDRVPLQKITFYRMAEHKQRFVMEVRGVVQGYTERVTGKGKQIEKELKVHPIVKEYYDRCGALPDAATLQRILSNTKAVTQVVESVVQEVKLETEPLKVLGQLVEVEQPKRSRVKEKPKTKSQRKAIAKATEPEVEAKLASQDKIMKKVKQDAVDLKKKTPKTEIINRIGRPKATPAKGITNKPKTATEAVKKVNTKTSGKGKPKQAD